MTEIDHDIRFVYEQLSRNKETSQVPRFGFDVLHFTPVAIHKMAWETAALCDLVNVHIAPVLNPHAMTKRHQEKLKDFADHLPGDKLGKINNLIGNDNAVETTAQFLHSSILEGLTIGVASYLEKSLRRILLSQSENVDTKQLTLCWVLHGKLPKRSDIRKATFNRLVDMFTDYHYIDLTTISGFADVNELMLVSNALKHGEGPSMNKVRKKYAHRFHDQIRNVPSTTPQLTTEGLQSDVQLVTNFLMELQRNALEKQSQVDLTVSNTLKTLDAEKSNSSGALLHQKWIEEMKKLWPHPPERKTDPKK